MAMLNNQRVIYPYRWYFGYFVAWTNVASRGLCWALRARRHVSSIVSLEIEHGNDQWPFQEPKLEVPTIYKAYFSGLCKGIYPQNMALYGTNVPPF